MTFGFNFTFCPGSAHVATVQRVFRVAPIYDVSVRCNLSCSTSLQFIMFCFPIDVRFGSCYGLHLFVMFHFPRILCCLGPLQLLMFQLARNSFCCGPMQLSMFRFAAIVDATVRPMFRFAPTHNFPFRGNYRCYGPAHVSICFIL